MKKQFAVWFAILLFLTVGTLAIALYGKGYRLDVNSKNGPKVAKTGLLVTTSIPDGAQVLIDGNLTTATDNTIDLAPGEYAVKIAKEGYFPWEKKLQIKEEIVTKADALLFPVAPKLESISTTGVQVPVLDPSGTKIAFRIASISARKNGVYILDIANRPILTLQSASRQIADDTVDVFSKATLSWSPDGEELMASISATLATRTYLLRAQSFNDAPRNITAILPTIRETWADEIDEKNRARIAGLKPTLREIIRNNFSVLSWSPDETKILYEASRSADLPLVTNPRLIGINTTNEKRPVEQGEIYVYDIKEDTNLKVLDKISRECEPGSNCLPPISWFPDSKHLIYVNDKKISVMDYDGTNRTTIYAGPFIDNYVYPWPNGSKIVILTNLNNTFSPSNLYTIGLK